VTQSDSIPEPRIRIATLDDIPTLVHHRVAMFRDMGELTELTRKPLTRASESFFRATVASGEYLAWLALTTGTSERVVAGAGLWLRPMIPRPFAHGVAQGVEGLIVNVYTEPEWRRRGLAALLMRHVLDYTRAHQIVRVLLHASNDGRALYESMGFVSTSEMRLPYP
jgi:ribosomal protein S18 acetylase RimI-like enzyme